MKQEKINYSMLIIKATIIEILVAAVFICIFGLLMMILELNKIYSPLLANISISIATLVSSYITSKKIGNKGYLTGLIVGGVTFLIITLISFIIDDGSITTNTLFHLIIIILSGMIGGVLGVNKKQEKYI
ncbi:MAG: TIGR04086 family membrane protein [Clostridia bacterium]|nr:TIGR04086 family membrane protein [Clostridia bacterium]